MKQIVLSSVLYMNNIWFVLFSTIYKLRYFFLYAMFFLYDIFAIWNLSLLMSSRNRLCMCFARLCVCMDYLEICMKIFFIDNIRKRNVKAVPNLYEVIMNNYSFAKAYGFLNIAYCNLLAIHNKSAIWRGWIRPIWQRFWNIYLQKR